MIFFNSIINAKGTPSFYEDTLANRPSASTIGRLFVRTDNPYGIYRDQGTSWQLITGSGGGGSQNWDQVLAQGGFLSQNRTFNFSDDNLYGLTFANGPYFQLQNIPLFKILYLDNSNVFFTNSYLKYFNSTNNNNVFSFNYSNANVALGDFNGQFNGTHFNVEVSNNRIYIAPDGNLISLFQSGLAIIGDGFNQNNLTKFNVDDNNQVIYTSFSGDNQGVRLQNRLSSIGDFDANFYNHYIDVSNIADDPYIRSYGDNANPTTWLGFNIVGYDSKFGSENMNLELDSNLEIVRSFWSGVGDYIGFMLDFSSNQYYLGDFNNLTNGGVLQIDAGNREANFDIDKLSISGAVTSTTSGATSAQHLSIYINGTHYKIQLRNP